MMVPSLCKFKVPDLVALLLEIALALLPGIPAFPVIPTLEDLFALLGILSCPLDSP